MRRFNASASIRSDSPRGSDPVIMYFIDVLRQLPATTEPVPRSGAGAGPCLHVDLHYRTHFDRTELRARNPRRNGDRLIDILRLDQVVSAELLLGLREWAVSHHRLAVAHANRGRSRNRLERRAALVLPRLGEVLGESHVLLKELLLRLLGQLFCLAVINQKHVFHRILRYPECGGSNY